MKKPMGWTETKLWSVISARNNDEVRRSLEYCLPSIETLLRSAGTSPIDFTLHDDQHSYRVAERIFEIAEHQIEALSDLELAQLLLSAYLHDIGMSPKRKSVEAHYRYLCTADDKLLNPIERQELQSWLDENWPKISIPLTGLNTISGIELAEEVCAYYCRARHNDWSEDWIQENLKSLVPGLYPGWVDDLVMLCKSHHEGYNELLEARFDARLVGSPATPINLRFLASLLRVADVLEFDPERTPPVILHHRGIAPKSRVYWHQDQAISFSLGNDKRELLFSARTPDARIHKAVLSVADYVNAELAGCHNLGQQGAFLRGVIPEVHRSKYVWTLPAQLIADIKEKDDSFTYIEGTFRPDVTKLLELLSGTQLYNDPLAAVRELVQNAADAIAEQIGYVRLQQDDAANPDHERTFGSLHKIRMTFEREGDRLWLKCADDGVGLNQKQIESRLLRSGANDRPEFVALEREARSKGFSVFRTGQFGIGLLSYFMLADRVEFDTRRSDAAGDGGGSAWTFVTEGVASFGELKKSSRDRYGTEVRLRLREDVISDELGGADSWFDYLEGYLKDTIRHLPCRFELRNNLKSTPTQWSVGPGWTAESGQFSSDLISGLREESGRSVFIPHDERMELDRVDARWSELKARASEHLRWFGPVEQVSAGFRARYWLPYFDLPNGASLLFFDIEEGKITRTPDEQDGLNPKARTIFSWKGFRTNTHQSRSTNFGVTEVDVFSGADISINRNSISPKNQPGLANEVEELERKAIQQFLLTHEESVYHVLNRRVLRKVNKYAERMSDQFHWMVDGEWRRISYPFAIVGTATYEQRNPKWKQVKHLGRPLQLLPRVLYRRGSHADPAAELGGARLCLMYPAYGITPVGLWQNPPSKKRLLWTSEFPPEWNELLFVTTREMRFWNADHPLVQKLNKYPDILPKEGDLRERFIECLHSEVLAARFLFTQMQNGIRMFKALRDEHPAEFARFVALVGADVKPIYWWSYDSVFSPESRTAMIYGDVIADTRKWFDKGIMIFPDNTTLSKPSEEFCLTGLEQEDEGGD